MEETKAKTKESMFDQMFRSEFNFEWSYQKFLYGCISLWPSPEGKPNLIIPKSRQVRMSSTLIASILELMKSTCDNLKIIYVTNDRRNANSRKEVFKLMAEKLGVKAKEVSENELSSCNKMKKTVDIIFTSSINNYRGSEFDLAVCDEFAFFNEAVSTLDFLLTCSKQVIITSTPFRGSYFNKLMKSEGMSGDKGVIVINSISFRILDATYPNNKEFYTKERVEELEWIINDDDLFKQEIYGEIL